MTSLTTSLTVLTLNNIDWSLLLNEKKNTILVHFNQTQRIVYAKSVLVIFFYVFYILCCKYSWRNIAAATFWAQWQREVCGETLYFAHDRLASRFLFHNGIATCHSQCFERQELTFICRKLTARERECLNTAFITSLGRGGNKKQKGILQRDLQRMRVLGFKDAIYYTCTKHN